MKKVLFIMEDFKYGGVEASFINLMNISDLNSKCEFYVVTWGKDFSMFNKSRTNNIKIMPCNFRLLDPFLTFLYKKLKLDVANTLKELIRCLWVFYKIKRMKIDTVVTYHFPYHYLFHDKILKYTGKFFESIVWFHGSVRADRFFTDKKVENIDKIVAVCDECKDIVERANPKAKNKTVVIENIIPYEEIRKGITVSENLFSDETFNIVTCARMTYEKGIDLAIEACKLLKERIGNLKWYIIGNGTPAYEESLKALAKQHCLDDNLVFIGPKENPFPYMQQCDLYVQPSKEESFGIAMAEAMVCGATVVSTDTVGGRHLVKNGITGMISPITADGLADTIFSLYNNTELQNTIKANVSAIDFSEANERIVNKFYELLGV